MEFSELIKTATVEDVLLSRQGLPDVRGTLCITSHHLLLSSRPRGDLELWLLIRNVDAVEKRVCGSSGSITLRCKDLKVLQLEIPGTEECLNVASSIEALSSVDSVMMLYPFFHRPPSLRLRQGWHPCAPERLFQQLAAQTSRWRLSAVNRDFSACPSYPPAVIVPAAVADDTVAKAARFRQGGRFPVLSYFHAKNGTALLRSSQPLPGPKRRRCLEDEQLLGTVVAEGEDNATTPLSPCRGRPLQESFARLVEACGEPAPSVERWLGRLDSSRWLGHVKAALSTACLAAQCLDREGCSVLVHGAEGTDTTLLVTALAQLILQPACRTLEGFQALLEREWIQVRVVFVMWRRVRVPAHLGALTQPPHGQAGHPFQLRCARSAASPARGKREAPVFLLFLDCVWQLSRQFPFSLEFGEQLLLTLFDNAYASAYGTFLCNSEKERRLCRLRERTPSLWARLEQPEEKHKYLNPLYSHNPLPLWPCGQPQGIQLWHAIPVPERRAQLRPAPSLAGFFLRWIRPCRHLDEAWEEMRRLVQGDKSSLEEGEGKGRAGPSPRLGHGTHAETGTGQGPGVGLG
ncbi:Myotubularin-related protein 9 [Lonchura striata]|uniref:Myotubularin-related protein 9 n=1 Tax=Lonchura striata TaxID=40157 RepID=A0A218UGA9_9PASE|nr:Myotubularin-related protein 9 [Lonchura striata domestica]